MSTPSAEIDLCEHGVPLVDYCRVCEQALPPGVPDAEHLTGSRCRCGHTFAAHYRHPSCRHCRCSLDPLCWCGELSSKHEDDAR